MVRNYNPLYWATAFSLFGAANALADHKDEHRHHEAHVHGQWELFAALDEKALTVNVKGPIVDILGYEYAPKSKQEKDILASVSAKLAEPENIFKLGPNAECNLSEPIAISFPDGFENDGANEKDDHHGHDEHDEHAHSDHEHHDDEEHAEADHEEHDEHEENVHDSDIEITYSFACAAPSRLKQIVVTGFDAYPEIKEIEAVFINDTRQLAKHLSHESSTFELK